MEFMLVWDWVNENDGFPYEQRVKAYRTKEELLQAKREVEEKYAYQISIGRLILSPAIGYSWADVERLF